MVRYTVEKPTAGFLARTTACRSSRLMWPRMARNSSTIRSRWRVDFRRFLLRKLCHTSPLGGLGGGVDGRVDRRGLAVMGKTGDSSRPPRGPPAEKAMEKRPTGGPRGNPWG